MGDRGTPPAYFLSWGDCATLWTALALAPQAKGDHAREMLESAFAMLYGTERDSLTLGDIMGMYDRAQNFEEEFKPGDRMVLMGLRYEGTVQTRVGPAEKVTVMLITRESYPDVLTYSALGVGFAAQAKASVPADFPHVAEYARVRQASGNEVKRFVKVEVDPRAWKDGDDGPAATIPHADDVSNGTPTGAKAPF